MFVSFSISVFAYNNVPYILPIKSELVNPTKNRMNKMYIILYSYLFIFLESIDSHLLRLFSMF